MRILFLNSSGGSMGRLAKALMLHEGIEADCFVYSLPPRRNLVHASEATVRGVFTSREWAGFMDWAVGHYDIIQTSQLPMDPDIMQSYDWLSHKIGPRHVWRATGFVHYYIRREDILPADEYVKVRPALNLSPFHSRVLELKGDHIHCGEHHVCYSSPEKGAYLEGDNLHWFPPIRDPEVFRPEPAPPHEGLNVFVPAWHKGAAWKGVEVALAALRELITAGHDINIIGPDTIVESGELPTFDERSISGHWWGYRVPHWIMPQAYAAVDIVLDQFLMGAYGNCAVEAMACGLPVVACNNRYPELAAAPVVHAETVDEIKDAVLDLTAPNARAEVGRQGREYAKRIHSPEAVAARARAIYEEILGAHPRH